MQNFLTTELTLSPRKQAIHRRTIFFMHLKGIPKLIDIRLSRKEHFGTKLVSLLLSNIPR